MTALRYFLAFLMTDVSAFLVYPNDLAQIADYYRRIKGYSRARSWLEASIGWDASKDERIRFSYRFPLLLLALVAAVGVWKWMP